ncbi:sugar ABC transporter substrate-binding protein [Vallitalea guaymasensis]|uniref:sugar ABC transporter substrate-binding protein n=1 Tax=Vallitalea guaymasensis TaxID=1185412 RepID=UPI002354626D|nr:ABC transporter substrate-binding protein [Vallitalea guaymasensis]
MKKIRLLLVLVLVLSTMVVGCKSSEKENTTSKKDDVTITLFQSKVEITEQLEKLAKEYSEMTDGVTLEVWGAPGGGYHTQLQAKLVNGQGPTIMSAIGKDAEVISDYLYDLSNEDFVKYIAPGTAVMNGEKLIGVPYGVEGYGFVYNSSLVNPDEVTDLASFETKLNELKDSGVQSISLSSESYFLIGHILNIPFALQDDPAAFVEGLNDKTKTMSGDPLFEEWAKFMEVIRKDGTKPLEIKYDVQTGDFATGKTAMIHQGNWCYGMFKDYDVNFDMSILPMPVNGNDKISVGIPNAWAINAGASEEEIKAATDFFNWLFTSEKGQEYIIDEFGFIPAMTNMKTESLDPLGKAIAEYTADGKTLPWVFKSWPSGIVKNDFLSVAQKFFADENMNGSDLLAELDKAWANATK